MIKTLNGCLAIALTLGLQTMCLADETVSQSTTTTEGPPVVLDSYMKPTVVQTKETTDSNGNVQKSVAPIIQERHEHVMLPASQTTTTVTERGGSATTVRSEAKVAAKSTIYSAPRKRIAHRVRHHYRAGATTVKPKAEIAQKTYVEKRVVEPAVTQRTDSTVTQSTVIDRKDPALDAQ